MNIRVATKKGPQMLAAENMLLLVSGARGLASKTQEQLPQQRRWAVLSSLSWFFIFDILRICYEKCRVGREKFQTSPSY
jgi:hypothetical protein